MHEYTATLVRIVDGDTYDFDLDLGFHVTVRERVRLLDLDTPEYYRPKSEGEKQHAIEVVDYLYTVMPLGTEVVLKTKKTGKYGRWLASISVSYKDATCDLARLLKIKGFEKRKVYDPV